MFSGYFPSLYLQQINWQNCKQLNILRQHKVRKKEVKVKVKRSQAILSDI